jgi:hypothetical protein
MGRPPDRCMYRWWWRYGRDGVQVERGQTASSGVVGMYVGRWVQDRAGGRRRRRRVGLRSIIIKVGMIRIVHDGWGIDGRVAWVVTSV